MFDEDGIAYSRTPRVIELGKLQSAVQRSIDDSFRQTLHNMICPTCPTTQPVPACAGQIQIGKTTLALDIEVWVYFESSATGRLERFEGAANISGDIIINTPELALTTSYEVWVTLRPESVITRRVELTLNQGVTAIQTDCYLLRWSNSQAGDYPFAEIVLA